MVSDIGSSSDDTGKKKNNESDQNRDSHHTSQKRRLSITSQDGTLGASLAALEQNIGKVVKKNLDSIFHQDATKEENALREREIRRLKYVMKSEGKSLIEASKDAEYQRLVQDRQSLAEKRGQRIAEEIEQKIKEQDRQNQTDEFCEQLKGQLLSLDLDHYDQNDNQSLSPQQPSDARKEFMKLVQDLQKNNNYEHNIPDSLGDEIDDKTFWEEANQVVLNHKDNIESSIPAIDEYYTIEHLYSFWKDIASDPEDIAKKKEKRIVNAVRTLYEETSKVGNFTEDVEPYIESGNYRVASKTIIGMMKSLNTAEELLNIMREDMYEDEKATARTSEQP